MWWVFAFCHSTTEGRWLQGRCGESLLSDRCGESLLSATLPLKVDNYRVDVVSLCFLIDAVNLCFLMDVVSLLSDGCGESLLSATLLHQQSAQEWGVQDKCGESLLSATLPLKVEDCRVDMVSLSFQTVVVSACLLFAFFTTDWLPRRKEYKMDVISVCWSLGFPSL